MMFNYNHIISHNINIYQCHMSPGHMHAQHMRGWLPPKHTITTYETTWPCNKAIWEGTK